MFNKTAVVLIIIFFLFAMGGQAADETVIQHKILELENRLNTLEDYVEKIQPSLVEFSDNLHKSIEGYTQGLEDSINEYSKKLEANLNDRLKNLDNKRIVLNPNSQAYQRIDTNSGYFLVFVKEITSIDKGYRLNLQIGNPNYADFKDFKIRLFWGNDWDPQSTISREAWRQSLNGAEYTFNGAIKKGLWNTMTVDLVPAGPGELAYLECELEVSSVELQVE